MGIKAMGRGKKACFWVVAANGLIKNELQLRCFSQQLKKAKNIFCVGLKSAKVEFNKRYVAYNV